MGTLTPAELEAVQSDVWEMIGWWRNRRLKQVHARTPRDTARQTYHIERRYIELIREEAEAEGGEYYGGRESGVSGLLSKAIINV
jgi:hypothetical protein